ALISIGKTVNYHMPILQCTVDINERQKEVIVKKIKDRFGILENMTIALLGLAFKPNTDDMREAPSIPVSKSLLESGAKIKAYDPVAMDNAKKVLPDGVMYMNDVESTLKDADCAVILTEWKEFKEFNLYKYKELMKNPILFDGRNCFAL